MLRCVNITDIYIFILYNVRLAHKQMYIGRKPEGNYLCPTLKKLVDSMDIRLIDKQ
jgi:hypothetical protein